MKLGRHCFIFMRQGDLQYDVQPAVFGRQLAAGCILLNKHGTEKKVLALDPEDLGLNPCCAPLNWAGCPPIGALFVSIGVPFFKAYWEACNTTGV